MSLTGRPRAFLYCLLVLASLFEGDAVARIGEIKLETHPALDSVRPHTGPVRFVLKASDEDGRALEHARFRISLHAPAKGWFFSTDFPLIEDSRLIEMELLSSKGDVDWEYLFPIRGRYRLEVGVVDRGGKKLNRVFRLKVKESRAKWLLLGLFDMALFLLGVAAGRIFTNRQRAGRTAAALMLMGPALMAVPVASSAPSSAAAGTGIVAQLRVGRAEVGRASDIHWSLSNRETGSLLPSRLTLAITSLEEGETVFSLREIQIGGDFRLKFHFTDAAPHRVSSLAVIEGRGPITAEEIVAVTSRNPPWQGLLPALLFFLALVVLGLVVGRLSVP